MIRASVGAPGRPWALLASALCLCGVGAGCQAQRSVPLASIARSDFDCPDPCDLLEELRIPNALKTEDFFNALTANPVTLPLVTSNPLSSDTFDVPGIMSLRIPLHDPSARNFMRYLVRCSFDSTVEISGVDPYDGTRYTWRGDAGLCPEWQTGAPSLQCLKWVSACVLARNNFFGIPIELSIRLATSGPYPTTDPPATVTEDIDREGHFPIPSFAPCGVQMSGLDRACGWTPDYVGICHPGDVVQIGAGGIAFDGTCNGPVLGTLTQGSLMLQICDDIDGCAFNTTRVLGRDDGTCIPGAPAVSFVCPSKGFFSAMVAPYDSSQDASGITQAINATFPASVLDVYAVREAAFFGNVFDVTLLDREIDVHIDTTRPDWPVVGKERALATPRAFHGAATCYDSDWTVAKAYAYHRVCAAPSPNPLTPEASTGCAAHVVGACSDYPDGPTFKCSFDRSAYSVYSPNYRDWEHCFDDGGALWDEPISVFLHGAGDVVCVRGQSFLCDRRQ
jgi:hypothetical protein